MHAALRVDDDAFHHPIMAQGAAALQIRKIRHTLWHALMSQVRERCSKSWRSLPKHLWTICRVAASSVRMPRCVHQPAYKLILLHYGRRNP